MISGKRQRRRLLGFGVFLLTIMGCQAAHDEVLIFERDVTVDEDEQVQRLLSSGDQYLRSEIYDEAELAYRKVLRLDPQNRTAMINLSYVLRQQGKGEEAFSLDVEFTRKFPDDAEGFARLGAAYAEKEDRAGAVKQMERAVQLDPKEPSYHTDLGYYYNEIGLSDEAIEAYEGALAVDPDNENTKKILVKLYKETGRTEEAAASLEAKLKESPDDPKLLKDLAKLYRDDGEFERASKCYDQLSKLDPQNTGVLKNLALCKIQVGDTTAAAAVYQRVVEVDPEDSRSRIRLAELLASPSVGKFREATETIQIALDQDRENARGWCVWGKALERLEEYEQAKEKFRKAVDLNDPVWSPYADKEISRQDQLIERAEKLKERERYEQAEEY